MERTLSTEFFEEYQRIKKRNVMRLLKLSMRYLGERAEELAREQGFSDFKIIYMGFVANLDPKGTTSSELAAKLSVTKQAISKLTKEIETHGFIEFRAHETDGRSSVIHLTEKGKHLLETSLQVSKILKEEMVEIAGEENIESLTNTLRMIVDRAEQKWGMV